MFSSTIGRLALNEMNKVNVTQAGEWVCVDPERIANNVVDSRIKEILDWLSPLTMYQKQHDILSRRHGNTGSWLLEDAVFQAWKESDCSQWTLWCPGNRKRSFWSALSLLNIVKRVLAKP